MQVPNFELIPEIDGTVLREKIILHDIEIDETVFEEQNMPINVGDLPITIRKGIRTCTQRIGYPLSHFISYDNPKLLMKH